MAWTNLSEDIAAEFDALEPHESSLEANLEKARAFKLAELREYGKVYRWQHKTRHTRKNRASLPPGLAHRRAAIAYQKRHRALGLCVQCPKPAFTAQFCKTCTHKYNLARSKRRKCQRASQKYTPVSGMCRCGREPLAPRKFIGVNCLQRLREQRWAKQAAREIASSAGTQVAIYSPC